MAKLPPAGIVAFINKIRHKLGRLQQKLVPPPIAALDFVTGMWNFQIVYTLCELGILDRLSDTPVQISEERVYRLLRAASTIGLVSESAGRTFTLMPIGKALQTDSLGSMRDFVLFQGRYGWASWSKLKDTVTTGKNAIDLLYNKSSFDFFLAPEVAETFNKAMTGISAVSADALLSSYSFGGAKTVADVGGGNGRLLGTVLLDNPHLQGILLDLPSVIENAEPILGELGVSSRCRVIGADFFKPFPQFAADIILMKNIIHDWSDEQAIDILRHVRERMTQNTRLVLYEAVVPGINEPGLAKYLDIEMMVHAHGKERTKDEYAQLLSAAGLQLTKVIRTPGPLSMIEARGEI